MVIYLFNILFSYFAIFYFIHTLFYRWLMYLKIHRYSYVWLIYLKTFGATVYVTVVNKSLSANRNLKNGWCNKIALQWTISRWSISVVYVCGCDCTTCWYLSKQSILRPLSGFGLQTEALFGSVVAIVTWLDRKGSGNTFPNLTCVPDPSSCR